MNPLRRFLCLAACLASLLSPCLVESAQTAGLASGPMAVAIDGNPCPFVTSWEGGYAVATVVSDSTMTGALRKKHVANIAWTPITVKMGYPAEPWLQTIINSFLTGQNAPHTLSLNGGSKENSIEAINASLVELDFSEWDGTSKAGVVMTLVFVAEQVRPLTTSGNPSITAGAKQKAALASNFSFVLDPLPTNRVARIAALSFKRTSASASVGITRESSSSGPLESSNLVLAISAADSGAWQGWAQDFLVNGNHLDGNEKTAQLKLLGPDMKEVLLMFQFDHVGLVRVAHEPAVAGSAAIARFEAELYFEGVSLVDPNGATSSAKSAGQSGTTPTSPATPATANPTSTTAGSPAPATPAATPLSTTPPGKLATIGSTPTLPGATATSVIQPTRDTASLPPAAVGFHTLSLPSAGQNVDDLGARDPEDIPRIDGLIRTEFRSYKGESAIEENASYTSKLAPEALADAYVSAYKGTDWEQVDRTATGDSGSFNRYVRLQMKRPLESAVFRISQTKTGGSEIAASLESSRAGTLTALLKAQEGVNADLAPAAGSPNDQGAADPANFPRIMSSVRKSYRSSGAKDALQEDVLYRAKLPIAQVEGFYLNHLTQGDWELAEVRESGDPAGATHQVKLILNLGRRHAVIFLKEIEAKITEINIVLTVIAP